LFSLEPAAAAGFRVPLESTSNSNSNSSEELIGAQGTAPKIQGELEDAVIVEAAPEAEAKSLPSSDIPRDESRLEKAGFRLPLPDSKAVDDDIVVVEADNSEAEGKSLDIPRDESRLEKAGFRLPLAAADDAVVVEAASEAEAAGRPLSDIPRDESRLQRAGFKLPLPEDAIESEASRAAGSAAARLGRDNNGFHITGFNQTGAAVLSSNITEERARAIDEAEVTATTSKTVEEEPVVVINAAISVEAEKAEPSQAVESAATVEDNRAAGLDLASSIQVEEKQQSAAASEEVDQLTKKEDRGVEAEEAETEKSEAEAQAATKEVSTEARPDETKTKSEEVEKKPAEAETQADEAETKADKAETKADEAEIKASEVSPASEDVEKAREGRKIIDLAAHEEDAELDELVTKGDNNNIMYFIFQNNIDKKENEIFLIFKEIQKGAGAKSYITNGLLIRTVYD
jgi:hypothetical protein